MSVQTDVEALFRVEEWQCPKCSETGTQLVHTADNEDNTSAEKSLRLHLRNNSGNGHGTENNYPRGYGPHVNLSKYITTRSA